ncbi:MAG: hypothetical protein LBG27_05275 [Spirochaetaceae bacterium]|jgi:hypothetical protein|nr:hypothetical protein [Spirochaetaceae bacterium]
MGGGETEPEEPKDTPAKEATAAATFSNGTENESSAIDVIRAAADESSLVIQLPPASDGALETVELGVGDLPAEGLVLRHSGDSSVYFYTSPANLTIDGGGMTVDLTGPNKSSLITVGAGVTPTLKNITFAGLDNNKNESGEGTNNAPLIKVEAYGHLILENGGTISGNTAPNWLGSGVYVAGGTFTMNGGAVSGNKLVKGIAASSGGGVLVSNGATFFKNGGIIYGDDDTTTPGNDGDKNNNTSTSGTGHAVYVASSSESKNDTLGENDKLDIRPTP